MQIGTVAGGVGVVTTIDTTWLGEFFYFEPAATPTAVKIDVLGEGVMLDLDNTGIDDIKNYRKFQSAADFIYLQTADGIIKGVNITYTFTNAHAQAFDVFSAGDNLGSGYLQTIRQTVLANSGVDFMKFAALFLPSLATATDFVTIAYEDGLTQIWVLEDIEAFAMNFQSNRTPVIDNLEGTIRNCNVLVGIQQSAYVMRFVTPKTKGAITSPIGGTI